MAILTYEQVRIFTERRDLDVASQGSNRCTTPRDVSMRTRVFKSLDRVVDTSGVEVSSASVLLSARLSSSISGESFCLLRSTDL